MGFELFGKNSTATLVGRKTNTVSSSRRKTLIYVVLHDGLCSAVLRSPLKIRPV
jgi:hypothetical protein